METSDPKKDVIPANILADGVIKNSEGGDFSDDDSSSGNDSSDDCEGLITGSDIMIYLVRVRGGLFSPAAVDC